MTKEKWDMKYRTKGFSVKMFRDKFAIYKYNKLITICRDELELETIFIVLCEHKIKEEYLYEYKGHKYSVKDIALKLGVSESIVYQRINKCTRIEDVFREKYSRKGNKNIRGYLRNLSENNNIPITTLINRYYQGKRGTELLEK